MRVCGRFVPPSGQLPAKPKNENPAAGGTARGANRNVPAGRRNVSKASRRGGRPQEPRPPVSVNDDPHPYGPDIPGRVGSSRLGYGWAAFSTEERLIGIFGLRKNAVAALLAEARHG
ncbi:hypothetical protein BLTE_35850 [Blastochloris tepida]|uniref:Uncharacterized protein n=1 Tax=Blastochloris tepida TaxID=2233851 RepID=A0A348G5R7_9HYPH|nr:hypothetical protein BLTE_35850 [Blastochloris tepida]